MRLSLPPLPMLLKYLIRFLLLMTGVACATYGLIAWHDRELSLAGVWLYDNHWRPHPLHFVVIGIGMIPPAMWEIFVLEVVREARRRAAADKGSDGSQPAKAEDG